jgi:hypothetical protein
LRREVNFAEMAGTGRIAETERHRFAVYSFTGFTELYDRLADPWERDNLAGKPEYQAVELRMMKAILDHDVVCRDLQIGGFDLLPELQEAVRKIHPRFDRPGEFKAAFPLMRHSKEKLRAAGIDPNYTNWFRDHEVLAHYGLDFEER